ncbi:VUT family protein [Parasutterella secunda]|uniref:VUT family protein n=1 Tax=Parasutterella secunda TaxID=626947 RepID=A0ABS2GUG6_9BURK|nr:VUT family protein [Parasutterella secunda]MBM6928846.1 VUT family protein [Parasutterella secunda]
MSHKWLNKETLCGLVALTLFILTIPLSNWVVVNVGLVCEPNGPCLIPVWPGLMAPSAVMIAGAALVLRNAVQAFLGAYFSLVAIAVGTALSALFASPSLVLASAAAFCFSELADFAVYTPMRKRFPAFSVVMAGLAGSVIDSAIFLTLAFGSIEFIFGQVLGKFWMSLLAGIVIRYFRSRLATTPKF